MWFTWLQTSLFDVRFAADSFYQRACKLVAFGIFTGFAIVGPIFNTTEGFQDAKAFKAMSLILMVSRLALVVQYAVVLWYVRGCKKVFVPLLLHVGILFIAAMAFLGLAFSFKYEMKDGEVVYKDGLQKETAQSNSFVGWSVIFRSAAGYLIFLTEYQVRCCRPRSNRRHRCLEFLENRQFQAHTSRGESGTLDSYCHGRRHYWHDKIGHLRRQICYKYVRSNHRCCGCCGFFDCECADFSMSPPAAPTNGFFLLFPSLQFSILPISTCVSS
jgi:hypothetical protein